MMARFRGEKEIYEVTLLPDLHGPVFLNRLQVRGLSSEHKYVISQQKNSLLWHCACRGFIFSKKRVGYYTCDHVRACGLERLQPGQNPPKAFIEVIGPTRWYVQMAQQFGEVSIAE